jgi:hypothetical protein
MLTRCTTWNAKKDCRESAALHRDIDLRSSCHDHRSRHNDGLSGVSSTVPGSFITPRRQACVESSDAFLLYPCCDVLSQPTGRGRQDVISDGSLFLRCVIKIILSLIHSFMFQHCARHSFMIQHSARHSFMIQHSARHSLMFQHSARHSFMIQHSRSRSRSRYFYFNNHKAAA